MPKYVMEEREDKEPVDPIEDGEIFAAKVVDIREVEEDGRGNNAGQKVKRLAFKVKLNAPETPWDGFHYTGKTWPRLDTREDNRLRQWAETLLGHEIPVGYELDTDKLVNIECRVAIGAFEKDDDKNPGKKVTFNFISDFFPARGLTSEPF